MSFGKATFPDPDIRHGPFRVLPRTDGGYVIEDERRPHGDRAVKDRKGEVMRWAKTSEAETVMLEWIAMGHG